MFARLVNQAVQVQDKLQRSEDEEETKGTVHPHQSEMKKAEMMMMLKMTVIQVQEGEEIEESMEKEAEEGAQQSMRHSL